MATIDFGALQDSLGKSSKLAGGHGDAGELHTGDVLSSRPCETAASPPLERGRRENAGGRAPSVESVPPRHDKNTAQAGASPAPPTNHSSDILRKVPPHNLEAEMSVLGSILLDNESFYRVEKLMRSTDFYREAHKVIGSAMGALIEAQTPIDAVTLTSELKNRGTLDIAGGVAYIAELAAFVPTAANVEHYARIVREMAGKRELARHFTELAAQAMNGTTLPALIGEADRVLKPLLTDQDQAYVPDLITPEISIINGRQLIENYSNIRREWLCEGFLARREVSMWSGKVEGGKTTLIRTLVMCRARGEDFLGRPCSQGKVLYAMLDADGMDLTTEEFLSLGWNPDRDNIDFLIDPVFALRPNSLARFYGHVQQSEPDMIVIDTFGRFQEIKEFTGYETTYAMAKISELAKLTNTHIVLINHIPRGRDDSADAATAAFGSVAIAGGVNARFVCCNRQGVYTLRTSRGKGGGFQPFDEEMTIVRDESTHWCSLGQPYTWAAVARNLKPKVMEFLNNNGIDDAFTGAEIAQELGIQRSLATVAAKMLADDGYIQKEGRGKSHDPYRFSKKPLEPMKVDQSTPDPDLFK